MHNDYFILKKILDIQRPELPLIIALYERKKQNQMFIDW